MSLSHNLRDTNHRLRFWLDSMVPGPGQPTCAMPEHMAALLSELLHAGAGLHAKPLPKVELPNETFAVESLVAGS